MARSVEEKWWGKIEKSFCNDTEDLWGSDLDLIREVEGVRKR